MKEKESCPQNCRSFCCGRSTNQPSVPRLANAQILRFFWYLIMYFPSFSFLARAGRTFLFMMSRKQSKKILDQVSARKQSSWVWSQQCLLFFLCVAEIVHSFVLFIYYRCKLFSWGKKSELWQNSLYIIDCFPSWNVLHDESEGLMKEGSGMCILNLNEDILHKKWIMLKY